MGKGKWFVLRELAELAGVGGRSWPLAGIGDWNGWLEWVLPLVPELGCRN